jgi:serine O-acetyltransferase
MRFSIGASLVFSVRFFCRSSVKNIIRLPSLFIYAVLSDLFNCYIGPDVIVPATTCFPHGLSGVFISNSVIIGENCVIYQGVTLGSSFSSKKGIFGAPAIGNNCFFGASCVCVGPITIGSDVVVGANVTVNDDIPASYLVVSQKPRLLLRSKN